MTGGLQVDLTATGEANNIPIAVEIVGPDGQSQTKVAELGEKVTFEEFDARQYSVQARLPSGETLLTLSEVSGDNEICARLEIPEYKQPPVMISRVASGEVPPFRRVWMRLWKSGSTSRAQVLPWAGEAVRESRQGISFDLATMGREQPRQIYLQIGADGLPARLVAVPPDNIRVHLLACAPDEAGLAWFSSEGEPGDFDAEEAFPDPYLAFKSHDPLADCLIGYLDSGQMHEARLIFEKVVATRNMSPATAIVAGFFLLNTRDLDRLDRLWEEQLEALVDALPDVLIIGAWRKLAPRENRSRDFDAARDRLVGAAARGAPLYTRALRLLRDGLANFSSDEKYGALDVTEALRVVNRFAAAADWNSTMTSFVGADPDSPGRLRTGPPEDPAHVWFLDGQPPLGGSVLPPAASVPPEAANPPAQGQSLVPPPPINVAEPDASLSASALLPAVQSLEAGGAAISSRKQVDVPPPRSDSAERRLARLLRAVDIQTQTEQFAGKTAISVDRLHPSIGLSGTAPERILGLSDWLPLSFVSRAGAVARAVGRVCVSGGNGNDFATGTLVSSRLLVTSALLLPSAEAAVAARLDLGYEDDIDGQLTPPTSVGFAPEEFFFTDRDRGFTLVAVEPGASKQPGWVPLVEATSKALIGEWLSSIQHIGGAPKQIALRSHELVSFDEELGYYTALGDAPSPGAPIFNDHWELIGIHRASVPARDAEGEIIAEDGAPWAPGDPTRRIRWCIHEMIRASRLHASVAPHQHLALVEEMLFLTPPDWSTSGAETRHTGYR